MSAQFIEATYTSGLCCSCGVCKGVCPENAIRYLVDDRGFFHPVINTKLCTGCGICLKNCPGAQYFAKPGLPEQYLYGFSNDPEVRGNSSSGGLATELLSYLLSSHSVDACLVVRNIRDSIEESEAVITDDLQVIRENKSSKYCPVSLGDAVKQIGTSKLNHAVIGLPCQIASLRRYFRSNPRVKYFLSLFCNHMPSYNATKYLLRSIGIKRYEEILYRGRGWPGYFQIDTADKKYMLPYRETVAKGFGKYFKSIRCEICDDPFGSAGDISFADAYFLTEKENQAGNTFCIVRNTEIMSMIQTMNGGSITLGNPIDPIKSLGAFKSLQKRIDRVPVQLAIMKNFRMAVPKNVHYSIKNFPSLKDYANFVKNRMFAFIGRTPSLWRIAMLYNGKLKCSIVDKKG
ncbi:MAG: Coenzyme F420 hydrogenase/dehydrogenase, beta subunit C-terminal domain [Spirochaetota bacterium]